MNERLPPNLKGRSLIVYLNEHTLIKAAAFIQLTLINQITSMEVIELRVSHVRIPLRPLVIISLSVM